MTRKDLNSEIMNKEKKKKNDRKQTSGGEKDRY